MTNDNNNILSINKVQQNLDVVIDNLDDFYSTMVDNNKLVNERFVIDTYNLGLTHLFNPDIRNKKSKPQIVPLTSNDNLSLKGFLT